MGDFTTGANKCFCGRQYKDANKLASCGDCPRDYIAGAWDARRKYIEHSKMTDRISTHADGCWDWGPKHYECAVREIKALREVLYVLVMWTPSADTYRRLGFNPETPMRAHDAAKALLAKGSK